ncbi:MAG: VWA domain-containing protein [Vicinamibacterales bacterium]
MIPARGAWVRHVPAALLAAGLPFALLAVADPHAGLVSSEVTYPGRRIALMIDASDSMRSDFTAPTLNAGRQQAFFTTVAAATRFVELRREGRYRDLIALIEFGNRAYVVTPFTSDYDNLLLSLALIGDPDEFSRFPDPGTVIGSAVEQGVAIFRTFDFLDAAGNVMVIFTDGEDTNARVNGRWVDEILATAAANRIPLYFVRTNYGRGFNDTVPDALWRDAVERAGGRFYIARDERSLLRALTDIDHETVGEIQVRRYATRGAPVRGVRPARPAVLVQRRRPAADRARFLDAAMMRSSPRCRSSSAWVRRCCLLAGAMLARNQARAARKRGRHTAGGRDGSATTRRPSPTSDDGRWAGRRARG